MLALVLSVASVDGANPSQPISATFPDSGGTMGRGDENTLVLPDSFSRVSRVHAAITFPAGYATISNASMTLPLRVRDVELAYRESLLLKADDSIEIGPYLIRVTFAEREIVNPESSGPRIERRSEQRTARRAAIPTVRLSAGIGSAGDGTVAAQNPRSDSQPRSESPKDNATQTALQAAPLAEDVVTVDPLTAAFLQGARLPADACGTGLTADAMQMIGQCLRAATAGAIDLLAARAITKFEVQADVTVFADQANNPFKFLPDADSVMALSFGKKVPGFMRLDAAMGATFADLRAHETGVIAGTRAAVVAALERFSPDALSTELSVESMMDRLLPSRKRAQLWELYDAHYQGIAAHAEQDFYGVFGSAFVDAYREETQRESQYVAMRKANAEKKA